MLEELGARLVVVPWLEDERTRLVVVPWLEELGVRLVPLGPLLVVTVVDEDVTTVDVAVLELMTSEVAKDALEEERMELLVDASEVATDVEESAEDVELMEPEDVVVVVDTPSEEDLGAEAALVDVDVPDEVPAGQPSQSLNRVPSSLQVWCPVNPSGQRHSTCSPGSHTSPEDASLPPKGNGPHAISRQPTLNPNQILVLCPMSCPSRIHADVIGGPKWGSRSCLTGHWLRINHDGSGGKA